MGLESGETGTQLEMTGSRRVAQPAAPTELWGRNANCDEFFLSTLQIYGRTSSKTPRARRFPSRG